MPTQPRWVGREAADLVALTRLRCYADSMKDLPVYQGYVRDDHRAVDGDFLLLERGGTVVGTATSLSMTLHARSGAVPCQGVAWVGTVKTERRKGNADTRGVASQVMLATLDRAREREEVVSALMPFRASFYEHFGYGVVERRTTWTIPLAILPSELPPAARFFADDDLPAMADCRTRVCRDGQFDIDAGEAGLRSWRHHFDAGFVYVVQPDPAGDIRAWMWLQDEVRDGGRYAKVNQWHADSHEAFLRLLSLLASWKDQYRGAIIQLPADWQVNRLLRESQVPHRAVDHPTATAVSFTRMQARILDHRRFLAALQVPTRWKGAVVLAIHESEGHVSKLRIEVESGRVVATPTEASPDLEMPDRTWAALASGDLPVAQAVRAGLLPGVPGRGLDVLRALGDGPPPWCGEYF